MRTSLAVFRLFPGFGARPVAWSQLEGRQVTLFVGKDTGDGIETQVLAAYDASEHKWYILAEDQRKV